MKRLEEPTLHKSLIMAALLALVALPAVPASARDLDGITKAEAALDAAWADSPLAVRQAFFVDGEPGGFGVYKVRADSKFKAGEKLVTYAEPVGYNWKANTDGTYSFGFDVDLSIKSPDGKELMSKADFAHLALTSHARNHEFMVILTLDLTGAGPGDYIAAYTLRDIASDKSTVINLPFSIVN